MPKIVKGGSVVVSDEVVVIREYGDAAVAVSGGAPPETEETFANAQEAAAGIVRAAGTEADHILAEAFAKAQAEREAVLAAAARDAEELRLQGYRQGMDEGSRAERAAIRDCIGQLELAVSRIEGEQAGFMAEYEGNLRWLSLEIASRVLGKRLERDDTDMASLVNTALNSVKNAEWITVELSEKMTGLIDLLTQELKKADNERVEIRGITAPAGTCVVDTPVGRIDASVYTQLANLKEYFAQE